jgi:hypothetical protein
MFTGRQPPRNGGDMGDGERRQERIGFRVQGSRFRAIGFMV